VYVCVYVCVCVCVCVCIYVCICMYVFMYVYCKVKFYRNCERGRWPNRAVLSEALRISARQRWPERAVGLRINECFCRVSGGVFVFSKSLAPKKRP
jgi:hypothetical protein